MNNFNIADYVVVEIVQFFSGYPVFLMVMRADCVKLIF